MIDIDPKVLENAKKDLKELSSKWSEGICKGKDVNLDGSLLTMGHSACHSWVDYGYIMKRDDKATGDNRNFLALTCHSKTRSKGICSAEAVDAIIEWMASDDSPFAKYILNRDDKDSLSDGAIILCGPDGASSTEAMWMCKVLRYSTESAQALDTWLTLYRGGVDPVFAVVASSYIRTVKGATFSYTGLAIHNTVFYNTTEAILKNVLDRKMDPKASLGSTSSLFGKPTYNGDAAAPKLRQFCKPYKKSDGWGGTVEGNGVSGDELVRLVLEWQNELSPKPKTNLEKVKSLLKPPSKDTVYLDLDM